MKEAHAFWYNFLEKKMSLSLGKEQVLHDFSDYVSSGKADFFQKYGMDFVMGRREGSYLYDLDGEKRLFNLHCNGGVFNLGHRNNELMELLRESLDELDIGNHHLMSRERAKLARQLAELMPGDLTYTVFGVSGGEAIDLAIKVSRGYTHRSKVISAKGGYHGHTGLALATGDEHFRKPFGSQQPGFVQVPFGNLKALADEANEETAAVILETVQATFGMVIPSSEYLQGVRELCEELGIVLIIDEVQTGLGRTGKLWAFEHFDIIPDIVVLGKGLSGGIYPITATVLRKPLESVFHDDPFIHISTFGGAELGCRVASRVLEISSDSQFLDKVNRLALLFREGVDTLQGKHGKFLKGLRQLGLMMGLELRDEISGPLLTKTAYDNDLLMVYAGNDTSISQFLPPLVMNESDVNYVLDQLDKALGSARHIRPLAKLKRGLGKLFSGS
jgi:acetylornithine/succinyldiaminopimelate/putrescine aminotransferase